MKVVCISEEGFIIDHPIKGEICKVLKTKKHNGRIFYKIEGYETLDSNGLVWGFCSTNFRPVDETFGEWVEKTILKDAELEHLYNNIYTTDIESEAKAFALYWGGSYERVTGFPNDYFKITI